MNRPFTKPRGIPTYTAGFESFWALYPRKVAKVVAFKSWASWDCEGEALAVMAGLRAQLPIFSRRDIENVPHPSTWLNQRRWEDSVQPMAVVAPLRVEAPRCEPHRLRDRSPRQMGTGTAETCCDCRHVLAARGTRAVCEDEPLELASWMKVGGGR